MPRGFLFLHEGRKNAAGSGEHGGGSVSMYQGVHSFHDPAAGEDAPDADVLVYDEDVRILALLESALRRVDADKLRRSSNLMLKVILP